MTIAKGSAPWILSALLPAFLFLILYSFFREENFGLIFLIISIILFLLTVFFLIFFRDPERNIGKGLVACADGRIREILNLKDEDVGDCTRISTFMNVHNVHVNRMPIDGTAKNITHIIGAHLPAFKKESDRNERVITTIDTKIGTIKIIQIAGTLARRIVPYIKEGDKLKKGERIGIIRLGSRVDVYLPSKKIKKIYVKVGDNVIAGEDTLAEIDA